jgi:hypothetical protein
MSKIFETCASKIVETETQHAPTREKRKFVESIIQKPTLRRIGDKTFADIPCMKCDEFLSVPVDARQYPSITPIENDETPKPDIVVERIPVQRLLALFRASKTIITNAHFTVALPFQSFLIVSRDGNVGIRSTCGTVALWYPKIQNDDIVMPLRHSFMLALLKAYEKNTPTTGFATLKRYNESLISVLECDLFRIQAIHDLNTNTPDLDHLIQAPVRECEISNAENPFCNIEKYGKIDKHEFVYAYISQNPDKNANSRKFLAKINVTKITDALKALKINKVRVDYTPNNELKDLYDVNFNVIRIVPVQSSSNDETHLILAACKPNAPETQDTM